MNVFIDKPIAAISIENVRKIEEIEQEQQTLMKEARLSIFAHQEEMISHVFHNPVACYMECFNNQNLQLMMSCELGNEDDGQST
jgi:hypothetical protein